MLAEDVLPRMSLPRGVGNSVSTLTYYALVLLGLLGSLAAVGFKVGEMALVSRIKRTASAVVPAARRRLRRRSACRHVPS